MSCSGGASIARPTSFCFPATTRSPLGIVRENEVSCRYSRVALVTNFLPEHAVAPERLERIRRCVIQKLGISPSTRIREHLGILLDERNRSQGVRHLDKIRRDSILFLRPLIFTIMEPSGKALPLPGMPCLYALIIAGFPGIALIPFSV
jgi:hypothetical protein